MTIKQYLDKVGGLTEAYKATGIRQEQWWRWSHDKSHVSQAYQRILKRYGITI